MAAAIANVLERAPGSAEREASPTRLSDVVAALSYALDLVEGQPMGHSVRSCLIGMRLAGEVDLGHFERSALSTRYSSRTLLGRILNLAQTVEVFHAAHGESVTFDVARRRAGGWFDPDLVSALEATRADRAFWGSLGANHDVTALHPGAQVGGFEPSERRLMADPATLDRISQAFAKVVDAKSPYTYRHSEAVAEIAVGAGAVLGMSAAELRELRRAALLHDIGKLGSRTSSSRSRER